MGQKILFVVFLFLSLWGCNKVRNVTLEQQVLGLTRLTKAPIQELWEVSLQVLGELSIPINAKSIKTYDITSKFINLEDSLCAEKPIITQCRAKYFIKLRKAMPGSSITTSYFEECLVDSNWVQVRCSNKAFEKMQKINSLTIYRVKK